MFEITVLQTRSYVSDTGSIYHFKLQEMDFVEVISNFYTQIGAFPRCCECKSLYIHPTRLTVPIFVTDKTYNPDDIEQINDFLKNKESKELLLKFTLPEYGGGGDNI
jgi:hypothetical protein